jgi:hypothetical protein
MKRKILHSILLICALGFSQVAPADRPARDDSVNGTVDLLDAKRGQINVNDTTYQLSPTARIVDATGQPATGHALRRGAKVKFIPAPLTQYGQLPVIAEIQILSHAR